MLLELELVRCDGFGVAVVDDEPGACGALVDGGHVHLLPFPRHGPSRRHGIGRGGREQRPMKWEGVTGDGAEAEQTNRWQLGGSRALKRRMGGRVYRRRRAGGSDWDGDGRDGAG